MSKWRELAQRIVAWGERQGFDPPTWDNFAVKAALLDTEIWEARTATSDENLQEELADITIRSLHMMQALKPGEWDVTRLDGYLLPSMQPQVVDLINCGGTTKLLESAEANQVAAIEFWRDDRRKDAIIAVELIVVHVQRVAGRLGWDLYKLACAKQDKNDTRPPRNGRVRSDG